MFDVANHRLKSRNFGETEVHFHDIRYQTSQHLGSDCRHADDLAAAHRSAPRTKLMSSPLEQLLQIMQTLRDEQSGCPWDRAQTFLSIAPSTLEEAYEVVDAIERHDLADLKDELGDLLFQVVFHSQMAAELGQFGFDEVAAAICAKLIRRHPHVFSSASQPHCRAAKPGLGRHQSR